MLSRHQCLLKNVIDFFNEPCDQGQDPQNRDRIETVYHLASQAYFIPGTAASRPEKKLVSVRIINWFVSNYAKFHMTVYLPAAYGGSGPEANTQFVVWNQYGAAKAGYKDKDMFDPYCRDNHLVCISRKNGTLFQSNLGQLNFFKWAIQNRIIDYVCAHYDDIVRDLVARMPKNTTAKTRAIVPGGTKTRKKREEISTSACQGVAFITIPRNEVVSVPAPIPFEFDAELLPLG